MWQQVDIPTVESLEAEWIRNPPVHYLAASYLGYKPPVQTSAKAVADIEDLMPDLGNIPVRKVTPLDDSAFEAAMKEIGHV